MSERRIIGTLAVGERYVDCKSADARALHDLMSELSEQCWCAEWLVGAEYSLYQIAFCGRDRHWGQDDVSPGQVDQLITLAKSSDSWWHCPEDTMDGPVRITLAQAAELYGAPPEEAFKILSALYRKEPG